MTLTRRDVFVLLAGTPFYLGNHAAGGQANGASSKPGLPLEEAFTNPPDAARPQALWMWMGSNISKEGITKDLEAMKASGLGGATIFSLADTVTPWAGVILKSPTAEVVTFTEPWWALLRHAAIETHRLGLELILHNCAGYESSGGRWITPELSMQEVVWSEQHVKGGRHVSTQLHQAVVDLHPHAQFPDVFIPSLGRVGVPLVEARKTYYRDIAVLALPGTGPVVTDRIINLTPSMKADGTVEWQAPAGDWTIYRFGHTTTGAMIQPAQWDAMGLECDKMSKEAVTFHVNHVLDDIHKHLGDLEGNGLTTLYFDSYEAGDPTWTARMPQEFMARRGYDIIPWLATFSDRVVGDKEQTEKFKQDFKRTVKDLYRDCYWATPGPLAHAAGLKFSAEPYEGPWEISEVVKDLDLPAVEFWTTDNRYSPVDVDPVVKAARLAGDPIIAAEAFTTQPKFARWNEHPAWLKPIGDAAFCAGVNRLHIHHFVQQPWAEQYKPGNAMGQWGIHLGRNQTWWKPGKAWLTYLWRCQSMLRRGTYVAPSDQTSARLKVVEGKAELQSIHRKDGSAEIYFVANVGGNTAKVDCTFPLTGLQPELWDPVWGTMRNLPSFQQSGGLTTLELNFAAAQSYFILFRSPAAPSERGALINFPVLKALVELEGSWNVLFDPTWGGPGSVTFDKLDEWTMRREPGIRYYSGTAIYTKQFQAPQIPKERKVYLDLGEVQYLADVILNQRSLGVVWTAPWRIDVTDALTGGENSIEIAVTNVWANRLIGDEQEPADVIWQIGDEKMKGGYFLKEFPEWFLQGKKRPSQGRYTFTMWNYFSKDSPLVPSGLLGPVRIIGEA